MSFAGHHPLQLLQWNEQDRPNNTWHLEKYTRLQDTRKQPLTVVCGQGDRLVIQFKEQINKMICLHHNFRELETFCIHPLLFSHDLISKENKLLFCIKDQIDGSIRYKFRVTFVSHDGLLAFCSTVTGYVTIKSYEEWSKPSSERGRITPTMQSFEFLLEKTSSSTPSEWGGGGGATPMLNQSFDTTTINETASSDAPIGNNNNNSSSDCVGGDGIGRVEKEGVGVVPPTNAVINVNIENLFSVEAVREFGHVLIKAIETCIAAKKTPSHRVIKNTVTRKRRVADIEVELVPSKLLLRRESVLPILKTSRFIRTSVETTIAALGDFLSQMSKNVLEMLPGNTNRSADENSAAIFCSSSSSNNSTSYKQENRLNHFFSVDRRGRLCKIGPPECLATVFQNAIHWNRHFMIFFDLEAPDSECKEVELSSVIGEEMAKSVAACVGRG